MTWTSERVHTAVWTRDERLKDLLKQRWLPNDLKLSSEGYCTLADVADNVDKTGYDTINYVLTTWYDQVTAKEDYDSDTASRALYYIVSELVESWWSLIEDKSNQDEDAIESARKLQYLLDWTSGKGLGECTNRLCAFVEEELQVYIAARARVDPIAVVHIHFDNWAEYTGRCSLETQAGGYISAIEEHLCILEGAAREQAETRVAELQGWLRDNASIDIEAWLERYRWVPDLFKVATD